VSPWRFSLSSTVRGIYFIRYLLFSGGAAIAAALIERSLIQQERAVAGLLIGFALGLLAFRGQLRPLRWPALAMSQQAIYLVRRHRAWILPWSSIQAVAEEGRWVTLRLSAPVRSPEGSLVGQIQLDPKKFGVAHESLMEAVRGFWKSELARAGLPSDHQLREVLRLHPA
jgi:hypothetical protein